MQLTISNFHRYVEYAGKTLEWLDSDSFPAWRQNMLDSEKRSMLEKYGWDKPGAISYVMNKQGFRTHEFNSEPGYIALGCSFTAGIGLPEHQVWPTIVQQATGTPVWNLGIGGAALDTCFRLLYNYIDQLDVRAVLLLQPSPLRFETHYFDEVEVFMPNGYSNPSLGDIKKYWYSNTQNELVNTVKNILAIQMLCNTRNIKLVIKDATALMQPLEKYPKARDLMHCGHADQQQCALEFINSLN